MTDRWLFLRKILVGVTLIVGLLGIPGLAAADSPSTNAVAQSYSAGSDVLTGMLVQPKDQTTVIPVTANNIQKTSGVVVPVAGADIVLTSPNAQSQQVLVSSTGRYNLLVSNQNGAVQTGDYLTVSALAGIAMKAGSEQSEAVGRAVGSFNGKDNVVDTVKLKSNDGRTTTVAVGYVQADIRLASNPLHKNENYVPGILAKAASGVANKEVSPARIYLSMAVICAALFVAGSMVYGGMRGSMTAIGRNPLAKKAISRGMLQAIIFGLVVFMLGVAVAYGILI